MNRRILRFTLCSLIVYLTGGALNPAVAASQPSGGNGTYFCGAIDGQLNKHHSDQYPNRHYARTFAANLNVGEPRTVRMIYFLPNDWQYRADVVQKMKDEIRTAQIFYAEQMEAHGYGKVTFRVETDSQGEPMVHRVDGQHPFSHYDNTLGYAVINELEQGFDLDANIYFIVLGTDALRQGNGQSAGGVGGKGSKNGGWALVPIGFEWKTVAHELGHAFGLAHDFRDGAYIMSYGSEKNRLSVCAAEFLAVQPHFNPDTPIEEEPEPFIELISPRTYPAGTRSVPIQFKVSDSEGLHQVILFVFHDLGDEVKACRGLMGEKDAIIEFNYDGLIPSDGSTDLYNPVVHRMRAVVVNTDGNWDWTYFGLSELSSQHIATFQHRSPVPSAAFSQDGEFLACGTADAVTVWNMATRQLVNTLEHNHWVQSVSFSPTDLLTLASGSQDNTVNLWNVVTTENIATLEGHTEIVDSVSFSPDGSTLASASWDNTIKLWDVVTQEEITTLEGHTGYVRSVSFSPTDLRILASGSWDSTVKLWDVATQEEVTTLEGHTWGAKAVSFSPDGTMLAAGSGNGTIKLWDVATRKNIATRSGHRRDVNSVSFSRDGKTLASGSSDNSIKLWDMPTLAEIVTLKGHTHWVGEVSFSPDGTILASGSQDSTAMLWNVSELMEYHIRARTEIDIPDPNLRAAVATTLGQPSSAPIFWRNMETLTDIDARAASINNLTGLELAINLRELDLGNNDISDISPVAGLTKLTKLNLGGNPVSNISPLAELIKLTELYLFESNISDISPLAGLTELTKLYLWDNKISDISAVAELTKLTKLNLGNNNISDISPLTDLTNLTWLNLSDNPVSDISVVAGLTNLTELHLWDNNISDISVVVGLTNLTRLSLGDNNISDLSPLVANTGLGSGDTVNVSKNPLSSVSIHTHIPALQSRGVTVKLDNLKPPTLEFLWSIPTGLSLIHVPLKVTTVDREAKTLTSIADLYDALGGEDTVNFLITYDSKTQGWLSYFGPPDTGTSADKGLTDDTGIIAGMIAPVSVHLSGNPLGTNGSSTITLNQGINLVGLPLRDSKVTRVSDLFALNGIGGNVPVVILTDNGEFKIVGQAGDPGDILIVGGQSFILTAQREAMVPISGDGWYNTSAISTAPPVGNADLHSPITRIKVIDTTPILALRGSIVDEGTGVNQVGIRVIVKNVSTSREVTTTAPDGVGYRLTVVDIETGRAAQIGDIFEISAQSPDPLIGVHPLWYTITAEDVNRSRIQLPGLVAYEIPTETELLANYPNPFNPETWMPYRLAEDVFVTLTVYDLNGHVVRTLDVGHRIAAVYENRSKAIYWDGKNGLGESVASGVYFYTLTAGDYSATRKMVILK